MITLLLVPMTFCLAVGFMFIGLLMMKVWKTPQFFFPKTVAALQEKIMTDRNSRIIYHRYSIWCSVAGGKSSPEGYLLFSLLGSIIGFLLGFITGNMIVSISLFLLLLLCPSLLLYARYISKTNKMIKSFCQFVDLFSRYYSSRKNIILAFREMTNECPKELLSELIVLNNQLSDGGSAIEAIETFAKRVNHHWAHDFATYIASGLEGETEDIQTSLMRLTNEMFVQQDEKQERDSEIHAIWISLLVVIVICILLIPYNQMLLKDSYRLYFFTPDGQALLSLAATVWCLSVLLAFIWGRRHG